MEQRLERLLNEVTRMLANAKTDKGKMRLQEQVDFLTYIKTGKKPLGISGLCHLI